MAKSNFNVVPNPTAKAGTTLENLKSAVNGETGATTKYAAYAKAAEEQGFPAVARLFAATSKAEQIHIDLEAGLALEARPFGDIALDRFKGGEVALLHVREDLAEREESDQGRHQREAVVKLERAEGEAAGAAHVVEAHRVDEQAEDDGDQRFKPLAAA